MVALPSVCYRYGAQATVSQVFAPRRRRQWGASEHCATRTWEQSDEHSFPSHEARPQAV